MKILDTNYQVGRRPIPYLHCCGLAAAACAHDKPRAEYSHNQNQINGRFLHLAGPRLVGVVR